MVWPTGILIAESLRDDAALQVVSWQLTRIERVTVTNLSQEQRAAGLLAAWTLLHFELPDARAQAIVHALADALMRPGWYAEFNTDAETFAVFASRLFSLPAQRRRGEGGSPRLRDRPWHSRGAVRRLSGRWSSSPS